MKNGLIVVLLFLSFTGITIGAYKDDLLKYSNEIQILKEEKKLYSGDNYIDILNKYKIDLDNIIKNNDYEAYNKKEKEVFFKINKTDFFNKLINHKKEELSKIIFKNNDYSSYTGIIANIEKKKFDELAKLKNIEEFINTSINNFDYSGFVDGSSLLKSNIDNRFSCINLYKENVKKRNECYDKEFKNKGIEYSIKNDNYELYQKYTGVYSINENIKNSSCGSYINLKYVIDGDCSYEIKTIEKNKTSFASKVKSSGKKLESILNKSIILQDFDSYVNQKITSQSSFNNLYKQYIKKEKNKLIIQNNYNGYKSLK